MNDNVQHYVIICSHSFRLTEHEGIRLCWLGHENSLLPWSGVATTATAASTTTSAGVVLSMEEGRVVVVPRHLVRRVSLNRHGGVVRVRIGDCRRWRWSLNEHCRLGRVMRRRCSGRSALGLLLFWRTGTGLVRLCVQCRTNSITYAFVAAQIR